MNKFEIAIKTRVIEVMKQANSIFFNYEIDPNSITYNFNIKGKTAGKANFQTLSLYFNMILFKDNIDEFMNNVIPHEVSHLYQRKMYPESKSHGIEFKYVMSKLGYTPTAKHQMDTTKIARMKNKPTHNYMCTTCNKVFVMSNLLHTKMMKGRNRICKKCKTRIVYVSSNPVVK